MRFRSSSLSIASVPVLALLAACSGGSFDVASGGNDSGVADSISSDTSVGDDAVTTDATAPPDASPGDAVVVVDGATCDTTKSPLDAPCVVSDLFGFFVSASGDDTGPGTAAKPFKTITKAYARASLAARHRIFVCNETFAEQVVAVDSIDLYGGLDCKNGWIPSGVTTLNSPASPAMVVKGFTSGARIESFAVTAPHGDGGGGSSIGLFVWGSQKILVRASTFNASLGGAGKGGMDGSQGDTGATGGPGGGGLGCNTMSPLVKGGAGGPTVGAGGAGATCDCSFSAKNTPFPGSDGALAASTCGRGGQGVVPTSNPSTPVCTPSNVGQIGCPGAPGLDGGGGKSLGGTSPDGYTPADGSDGSVGGGGGGGGGGGTALVNSLCFGGGGGGGGGGAAGGKGTAGGGGGASFGVLSVNSDLTLRACKANGAKGGIGGLGGGGGKGGPGAAGGLGGPQSATFGGWAGCLGGAGGEGGAGGDGGGGGGGPSAGVAYAGTTPISKDSTVAKAGQAGAGGGGPGSMGAAGTAQDLLAIP